MTEEQVEPNSREESQRRYRRILRWLFLVGAPLLGLGLISFLTFWGGNAGAVQKSFIAHFAAVVGLPGPRWQPSSL